MIKYSIIFTKIHKHLKKGRKDQDPQFNLSKVLLKISALKTFSG